MAWASVVKEHKNGRSKKNVLETVPRIINAFNTCFYFIMTL